jgi:hypothetical protein
VSPRRRRTPATETVETRPMVYDGYYGRFVPVEHASFDVATTPEAVVELPWPDESPAGSPGTRRRRRPAGPGCDSCRERGRGTQRSRDGALVVCRACARGVPVGRLDAAEAVRQIVGRAPAADRAALERRLSRRRAVRTARLRRQISGGKPGPPATGPARPQRPGGAGGPVAGHGPPEDGARER